MAPEGEIQRRAAGNPAASPAVAPNAGVSEAMPGAQAATAGAGGAEPSSLTVRPVEEPAAEEADTRLDRLPMRLDALVKVHSFRVRDLLAMEKGTIVETVHEHSQDVPVRCAGALLVWAEFEVLDMKLAVRITRLA